MAIEFEKDVGTLSPEQLEGEIQEMNTPGSPVWDTKPYNPDRERHLSRREALYNAKYKGDAGISSEDQGLHKRITEAGLTSPEQIETEAAHARGEAVDSKILEHMETCENTLRGQWGDAESYKKNLESANAIFDQFVIEEVDQDWLKHTPRDGKGVALGNNPKFIALLSQIGEILIEHNTKYADELAWFNRTWKPKPKKK